MKRKYYSFKMLPILVVMLLGSCSTSQHNHIPTTSQIQGLIQAQQFIFTAETMLPLRGEIKILNTPYDVTVGKDTLVSYLPYFGRAYQAPVSPTDAGVQFTSVKFEYKVSPAKKNGWQVKIVPLDNTNIREMNFDIFNDGSAGLNVISNFRDAISYRGHIAPIK
ncbi:MAG: DUF4251 domain-containing protein [Bacteroidetes bacterium]|nr:DUF4251 domain-containing protein [Bacteroidota bacterium]